MNDVTEEVKDTEMPSNIEQLKELREKINDLSEDEKIKRDLYLKKLATGELQGPPTGYRTIDKPWLQFHSDEAIETKMPNKNAYDMLMDCNKDRINSTALNFIGKKKYTYAEMEKEIEKTEKAFINMGVRSGDEILLCMANTPEAVFNFYALAKLGAIANFVDPRSKVKNIVDYINDSRAKHIIAISDCIGKYKKAIRKSKRKKEIKSLIDVSPVECFPKKIKNLYKLKSGFHFHFGKTKRYEDFINNSNDVGDLSQYESEYKADQPVAIVHTGGTTGTPKGVLLTHDNFNSMAQMHASEEIDLKAGDTEANFVPMFTAFGLVTSLHMPLCLGIENILIPELGPDDLDKILVEYKPNHIMSVPVTWETLLNSKLMENFDLSFLKSAIVGADSMKKKYEQQMNEFFANHNCKIKIGKGYGMTEVSSGFTYTFDDINNIGKVGVPHVKNIIGVFDPETRKEIRGIENVQGEVAMQGPTVMKEYVGTNAKETSTILKEHEDGAIYAHTGDIGTLSLTGDLTIDGRMKRWIIKKGFKLYASEIENVLASHPGVEEVAVVAVPDEQFGSKAKAHIVLGKAYKGQEQKVQKELSEICRKNLPDYSYPDFYKFRDSLPLTGMMKINFKALEKEDALELEPEEPAKTR